MKKKKTLSDYLLLGVFLVLVVVVLVLLIKVIANRPSSNKTNFEIPIVDTKLETNLSINLKELQKQRNGYILTISSYHDKDIPNTDITYNVKFTNNSNATIKVYKNDDNKNLASKEKEFTLTDKFKTKEKRLDNYKILVEGNIKEGDTLDIKVSS